VWVLPEISNNSHSGEKNICILVLHGITHTKGDNGNSMCCEYVTFDNAKNIASPWRLFDKFKTRQGRSF
jgi:hypothetical protein